ncbi:hypothetical protein BS47DRAFT_1324871 [Hydnum rufescens UP504]|uniref:Protein kinase domain-containing protein n=1 Tax=Hydnum rufescens UP504 TaxID=1448309 RepID=A0A9P6E1H2_9AGAM|nr:hypothetical protein BS47DRAFT_1324871 [Hydnum rufescens UP504]
MALTVQQAWRHRRERLVKLLGVTESKENTVDALAIAIERAVLKKSANSDLESLRFSNRDLISVKSLEKGQFGTVDIVKCRLDGHVYARKTIQRSTADRFREQCFVLFEKDILVKAHLTKTPWVPHLLCALQAPSQLAFVMQYADGGTLWDVLECATDSRITEADLRWWVPQAVEAISWCHSQGFAHRDIKPHNFVITQVSRLQLIDFGCAAPLLDADPSSGVRCVAKPYCLVPCGTCDYISPEILQAHEDALYAAELRGESDGTLSEDEEGYGCDTDWWSLGIVMYELVLGVAPFFATDIQRTYSLIVGHERSKLRFDPSVQLTPEFKDLVCRFLTCPNDRLGRTGAQKIRQHAWFTLVDWSSVAQQHPPASLVLPHVTRSNVGTSFGEASSPSDNLTSPFDFSHLFKSSPGSTVLDRSTMQAPQQGNSQSEFLGFSWGPPIDAFDNAIPVPDASFPLSTPSDGARSKSRYLQIPGGFRPELETRLDGRSSSPYPAAGFATPVRPTPNTTIPQTMGTSQRHKRMVSDREALRQMISLVSASARKKVMESGRKPRFSIGMSNGLADLERPKIPGPLLKRAKPELQQLHTSLSLDESAPPSPSPRPGSALSRRSGSASPFPFVRSSVPSFILEPTSTNVTTTTTLLPASSKGENTSRIGRTVFWQEDQQRRRAMRLRPDVSRSDVIPDLREGTNDLSIGILESDLDRLLRELTNIEKRVSSLKSFTKVDATLM